MYINKCNVKNYITTNDINIGDNITLSDIMKLINQNKDLIRKDYETNKTVLSLDEYLKNNLDNLEEALLERKIYNVNIIKNLYNTKNYRGIVTFYKEFLKIKDLLIEFKNQKQENKKLIFMFKNDKSLVRDYLDKTNSKYKGCVYKNLLDLETNTTLFLPKMCYNNHYLYVKDEFLVKSVYTFIDDYVIVLGVIDKGENLEEFVKKNEYLINDLFENFKEMNINLEERNIILKDIKLEDLILSIDLNTLDINEEDNNGR